MPACPACHAEIADVAGTSNCPFCGTTLERSESSWTASDSSDLSPAAAHGESPVPPLPDQSRIEIVAADEDHLVLHLPPGGSNARGLGCFALFWNGFMTIFTPPWFLAGGANGPPLGIIVPFLLVFWAVGLGMAYAWARMRFTRVFLLLDRDRVAIQSQWFRWKSFQEALLGPGSQARLVESYRVNDEPVHAVRIAGEGRTISVATQLSGPEKQWLVDVVNRRLAPVAAPLAGAWPNFCPWCGGALADLPDDRDAAPCPHCGEEVSRLPGSARRPQPIEIPVVTPAEVPPDSDVRIEADDGDRLRFSLPLLPAGAPRAWIAGVTAAIGLVWTLVNGASLLHEAAVVFGGGPGPLAFDLAKLVFSGCFMLPGLFLLGASLAARRGRIAVDIASDWTTATYGWGLFRIRKRLATAAIDAVKLRSKADLEAAGVKGEATHFPGPDDLLVATVHVGTSFLPLTTIHNAETAKVVAGLTQSRLQARYPLQRVQ